MSANINFGQNSRFKIGWIILLILAGLMTLNHAVLIFALDDPDLFAGFAAFNLYSLVVLYIPFRRGEKWAWYTTWILPIGLAAPALTAASDELSLAISYCAFAGICVLGLILTMREFFPRELIGDVPGNAAKAI